MIMYNLWIQGTGWLVTSRDPLVSQGPRAGVTNTSFCGFWEIQIQVLTLAQQVIYRLGHLLSLRL